MNAKAILLSTIICAGAADVATAQKAMVTGPHAIVYKTKANYKRLVPVVLSEDKSRIESYPDPHDVKAGGSAMLPTELHKGYLLDNRGIGANTAFLKMTWEKYAALPTVPSTDELYKMIIDKDPFSSICDCGSKRSFKRPAADLNKLIDSKKLLKTCKPIKPGK